MSGDIIPSGPNLLVLILSGLSSLHTRAEPRNGSLSAESYDDLLASIDVRVISTRQKSTTHYAFKFSGHCAAGFAPVESNLETKAKLSANPSHIIEQDSPSESR